MASIGSPVKTYTPKPCKACGIVFTPRSATEHPLHPAGVLRGAEGRGGGQAQGAKTKARPKPKPKPSPVKIAFADVALATVVDRPRPLCSADVRHRFMVWLEAREALREGERGAGAAYRQGCIELAGACVRVAAELPPVGGATPLDLGQSQSVHNLMRGDVDEALAA